MAASTSLREWQSTDFRASATTAADRGAGPGVVASRRCLAQWTLSQTVPGVLRGPHLHKQHVDQLVVLEGDLFVGLVDLRRESRRAGMRSTFALAPCPGPHHPAWRGPWLLLATATDALNATSHEYDPADDLEVRFDDPDLGLVWPTATPVLSDRDHDAPTGRPPGACRGRGAPRDRPAALTVRVGAGRLRPMGYQRAARPRRARRRRHRRRTRDRPAG